MINPTPISLPKDYSGSPATSLDTPWTEAEVLSHLIAGLGDGAITELKLEYCPAPNLCTISQ
jgi:hypothetical protein